VMMILQKRAQCVCREVAVAQDLRDDPGSQGFASMDRYHRRSPIGMPEEVVAASYSNGTEAGRNESRNQLGTGETRQAGHDAKRTRCTPTKSSVSLVSP